MNGNQYAFDILGFHNGLDRLGVTVGGVPFEGAVGHAENGRNIFRDFLCQGVVFGHDSGRGLGAQRGCQGFRCLAELKGGISQFSISMFSYS